MSDKFPSLPVEPATEPPPVVHDPDPRAALIGQALEALRDTDYVTIKAVERGLTISPEWRAWREALREVVRGDRAAIPAEPARYA